MLNHSVAGGDGQELHKAMLRGELKDWEHDWCVGCAQPEWYKLIKSKELLEAHFEAHPGSEDYFFNDWLPHYKELAQRLREHHGRQGRDHR